MAPVSRDVGFANGGGRGCEVSERGGEEFSLGPIGVSLDESVASRTQGRVSPDDEEGVVVSFADKVSNKVQELRGRIKRNTGEVTGDKRLQAEGRADEVQSNLKQAGEKIKDAFRGWGTRRRRR